MNRLFVYMFAFGLLCGVARAEPAKTSPPAKPASVIQMKTTSFLDDGTRMVQTRNLSAYEAEAMGVLGGESVEGATDGAPPRPNAPLPGSVPAATTRVDYHLETNGWTRDTAWGRVLGGNWVILKDTLVNTAGPPDCNPNDDSCGQLPN